MSELKKIKNRLLERRKKLKNLLEHVEKSARRKLDKDFEEQAIQRENEEVLTSLDNSLNDEFEQIEKALLRMKKGEYGKCETCGNDISKERLENIPYTSFCIKCAD